MKDNQPTADRKASFFNLPTELLKSFDFFTKTQHNVMKRPDLCSYINIVSFVHLFAQLLSFSLCFHGNNKLHSTLDSSTPASNYPF